MGVGVRGKTLTAPVSRIDQAIGPYLLLPGGSPQGDVGHGTHSQVNLSGLFRSRAAGMLPLSFANYDIADSEFRYIQRCTTNYSEDHHQSFTKS